MNIIWVHVILKYFIFLLFKFEFFMQAFTFFSFLDIKSTKKIFASLIKDYQTFCTQSRKMVSFSFLSTVFQNAECNLKLL